MTFDEKVKYANALVLDWYGGDESAAQKWLNEPCYFLRESKPRDLLQPEAIDRLIDFCCESNKLKIEYSQYLIGKWPASVRGNDE